MSEANIMVLNTLEKYLVSRLKFIRQLSEFLPDKFSEEEQEIVEVLKQLTDYDISAQTVRKIERKYYKSGSDIAYTHQLMTYIVLAGPMSDILSQMLLMLHSLANQRPG